MIHQALGFSHSAGLHSWKVSPLSVQKLSIALQMHTSPLTLTHLLITSLNISPCPGMVITTTLVT